MINTNANILEVAQAISEPLRLAVLQHLMGGPATVSELVSTLGTAQSKVSNHLALLRRHGLVHTTQQGRQIVYELRDRSVADLVEALAAVAGARPEIARKSPPLASARSCYDHLAGKLGVAIFAALVANGAIKTSDTYSVAGQKARQGWHKVELGPAADEVFTRLGVNLEQAKSERRKFATACLDWTERRPHLGGALGAELYVACLERGWVIKRNGARVVTVTPGGRRGLRKYLGLQFGVAP